MEAGSLLWAYGIPRPTRARYTSPTILSFRQKRYGHGASMLMAWIGVGHGRITTAPTSRCKQGYFATRRGTQVVNRARRSRFLSTGDRSGKSVGSAAPSLRA